MAESRSRSQSLPFESGFLTRRVRTLVRMLACISILVTACVVPAGAQTVVTHIDAFLDDGVDGQDADGVKNGVVIFAGDKRHVIASSDYRVDSLLIIRPRAIVEGGGIGGKNSLMTRFEITDATIIGTTISRFHAVDSFIKNSTLSDCTIDLPQGSVLSNSELTNCRVSTRSPADAEGQVVESPPHIEFNYMRQSGIDSRGSSVVITGNTMIGPYPSRQDRYAISLSAKLSVGGLYYPTGFYQTKILGNTLIGGGIEIESRSQRGVDYTVLDDYPVFAVIQGNTITADLAASPRGAIGVDVEPLGNTKVLENEITGFYTAVLLRTELTGEGAAETRPPSPDFQIANNAFAESNQAGIAWYSMYAPRGPIPDETGFVDARFNWWGSPDGPSDLSNADGYYHEGGGLSVDDQILYWPYQGTPLILTEQELDVQVLEGSVPYQGIQHTFRAEVLYTLFSGPATVELRIWDDRGDPMVDPWPTTTIPAGSDRLTFDDVVFEIPEDALYLEFQTSITPDVGAASLSEKVRLYVENPTISLEYSDFDIIPKSPSYFADLALPSFIPGVPTTVKGTIAYAYPDLPEFDNVSIVVHPKEWITDSHFPTNVLLTSFEPRVYTTTPGSENTIDVEYELTVFLRDFVKTVEVWNRYPIRSIRFAVTMFADGIEMASKEVGAIVNDAANHVQSDGVRSAVNIELKHFETGFICEPVDHPGYSYFLPGVPRIIRWDSWKYRVETAYFLGDFADWQVTWHPEMFDDRGNRIEDDPAVYRSDVTRIEDDHPKDCKYFGGIIPETARIVEMVGRVLAPGGQVVYELRKRMQPAPVSGTARVMVPIGSPSVALGLLPVHADFVGVLREGEVAAFEMDAEWNPDPEAGKTKDQMEMEQSIDRQFRRFWDLYTTLPANSFTVDLTITYDPATDFPGGVSMPEDSLTVAVWDTTTAGLAFVPTVRDTDANTLMVTLTNLNTPVVVGIPTAQITYREDPATVELPETFGLGPVYPNPFLSTVSIPVALSAAGPVRVVVYDVLGRQLGVLLDAHRPAGLYSVRWDAGSGDHASGLYLVRMTAGQQSHTIRMILVKD